jgi:hypothetical protein
MTCQHLIDNCGCCTPVSQSTPAAISNTAGKPIVERRVGTASTFSATMAAHLTGQEALAGLTYRQSDDPAIALVDAWSVVLDVLTFYSERLANEGYLRTAVDSRSLTELAHSVGYTPGRGRAAAAMLALTLEEAAGSPDLVPVPRGTKVASLPGPGEVPQNYETTEELEARPAWNAIRARSRVTQLLVAGATAAYVEGLRTDIAVGDAVLLVGRERAGAAGSQHWAFRLLTAVQPIADLNSTKLTWTEPLTHPASGSGRVSAEKVPDPRDSRLFVLRRRAGIFGAAAPDFRLIDASVTAAVSATTSAFATSAIVIPDSGKEPSPTYETEIKTSTGADWPEWTVRAPEQPENTVDLDAVYPAAVQDSWAVLTRFGVTACYRIEAVGEVSRTDYTLNSKVSRLTLQGPPVSSLFGNQVRQTTAWVGSELLPLSTSPVVLPVQGDRIDLARAVPTLEAGHSVVVRGPRPVIQVAEDVRDLLLQSAGQPNVALHPGDRFEVVGPVVENQGGSLTWGTTRGMITADPGEVVIVPADDDADVYSEVAAVAGPTPEAPEVVEVRLAGPLTGCYDRETVRILANVAPSTHGETRTQVLGSGDAATPYQRFRLAQNPLTYVAAKSGGAVVSTLEIRVDGRLWTEVPRLFGTGPSDEVYTTVMDDDGVVTIQFGDGATGARLPTGTNNVAATYRVGTGLAGRVAAEQLTLLMSRPLGLRSVTNPVAAGLAADPEPPEAVRSNAARAALTLDRVVSIRDVEDFARSVPGIGKARADGLWDGRTRLVHLTVAGVGAQTVDEQAITDLAATLRAIGDPRLPLVVQAAEVVPVYVTASVVVDAAYEPATVLAAVAAEVTAALTVEARALGQPLTSGDIVLAAHRVPGAAAVIVSSPPVDVSSFQARIVAGTALPAQLVALAPGGLTLTEAVP